MEWTEQEWDAAWNAAATVRDDAPRRVDDAPTDDVIDAVLAALVPFVAARVAAENERLWGEIKRLRAQRADIWSEGFEAGHQAARAVNPEWPEQPANPYRIERGES